MLYKIRQSYEEEAVFANIDLLINRKWMTEHGFQYTIDNIKNSNNKDAIDIVNYMFNEYNDIINDDMKLHMLVYGYALEHENCTDEQDYETFKRLCNEMNLKPILTDDDFDEVEDKLRKNLVILKKLIIDEYRKRNVKIF